MSHPGPPGPVEPSVGAWPSKRPDIPVPPGLYLVATPIGNLADITLRALAILQRADVIACEDTRVTGRLRSAFAIGTPMTPYHEHNAERVHPLLIERLKRGETVALVSDAGTPLVSDPGFRLVRAAIEAELPVYAAPGASALLTALCVAGLPTDRFLFAGFLPARAAARRKALADIAATPATLVLYEAPHRLAEALADMADILGARPAALCRELTKRYEEVRRGELPALAAAYAAEAPPKGEIVIVIGAGAPAAPAAEEADVDDLLRAALRRLGTRDAAAEIAARTGLKRRDLYARALALAAETTDGGQG